MMTNKKRFFALAAMGALTLSACSAPSGPNGGPEVDPDSDPLYTLLDSTYTTPQINSTVNTVSVEDDGSITVLSTISRPDPAETPAKAADKAAQALCEVAVSTFQEEGSAPPSVVVLDNANEPFVSNTTGDEPGNGCSTV